MAVVCGLLLAASLGVIGYSVDKLRDSDQARVQEAVASQTSSAEREAVLAAARTFFVEANNFSVQRLPEYTGRVEPLLTPGFAKSFKKAANTILGQLIETELSARGRYVAGAVESIDPDSAAVLVAGNARSTSTVSRRVYFPRWRVSLVKDGDIWLVDDYTELGDAGLAFQP